MENYQVILVFTANFIMIALACEAIGQFFKKVKSPPVLHFPGGDPAEIGRPIPVVGAVDSLEKAALRFGDQLCGAS